MCGRYTLTVPLSNLVDAFDVPPPDFEHTPRFNIAPTQVVPIVAQDQRGRRMGQLRWGLIPSWSKDPAVGSRLINARCETVAEKPSFRAAFSRRRCLVPADGFFEWKKNPPSEGGRQTKTPYWIHSPSGEPFAFAGIWERWGQTDGTPLFSFTILTTEASPDIRHIHPRMPVILPLEAHRTWLDPGRDPSELRSLLVSFAEGGLRAHPVSTLVNSVRNDMPECIEPSTDAP